MIKIGIIGLGKMGLSHFAIFNAHPEVEVTAVCDPSPFMKIILEKYMGKQCYKDYKQMIDEKRLDAVVVATPTRFHSDIVKYALNKKLHVFCEKPFCLKVEEGRELIALAERNGLVNQVGYHCRFTGVFQKTRELLDRKVIGDVYHFMMEVYGNVVQKKKGGTWRSDRAEGGGCLFDYASHGIDLVHYLVGPTRTVRGTCLKKVFSAGTEDAVFSTLECADGVSGLLSVNWCDPTYRKMANQITIMGTNGKLVADRQECKVFIRDNQDCPDLEEGWNMFYTTDVTKPVWFYLRGEEYSYQVDYFVQCIKNKSLENLSSFENALQADIVVDLLLKDGEHHG